MRITAFHKRALIGLIGATVVLVAALLLLFPAEPSAGSASPGRVEDRIELRHSGPASPSTRAEAEPDPGEPGVGTRPVERGPRGRLDAQEREHQAAVRARILAGAPARDSGVATGPSATSPTALKNRAEGYDELVAELNRDFMPLADECVALAQERQPELAGMLAVGLELVADEELGAVVELVDFPERNEVDDLELQDCVRESLLSMLLPASAAEGRAQLMLTIPVDA